MSVMVTLEADVKSTSVAELPAMLKALLPSTRAFAGCRKVDVYLSQDGRKLLLVEDWDSKEDQLKYGAWRVTTEHGRQLMGMLEGPPRFGYFDKLDV